MHCSSEHKDKIRSLYELMSDGQKNSDAGQRISEYLNPVKPVETGDMMADGDFFDIEGNICHLSELKGKHILLDFWSRGCGPCLKSIPEIEKVKEMFGDRLSVVGVSMDGEKLWKKAVEELGMSGYQWNDLKGSGRGAAAKYGVKGVPYYVLIGPDGIIRDVWAGYADGIIINRLKDRL